MSKKASRVQNARQHFSILSHKEFRFLLGVMPLVMHICGTALHSVLDVSAKVEATTGDHELDPQKHAPKPPKTPGAELKAKRRASLLKTLAVAFLIIVNLPAALYTSLIHQRGNVDVMSYLHKEAQKNTNETMSILYLMPCHSTPYYRYPGRYFTMFPTRPFTKFLRLRNVFTKTMCIYYFMTLKLYSLNSIWVHLLPNPAAIIPRILNGEPCASQFTVF